MPDRTPISSYSQVALDSSRSRGATTATKSTTHNQCASMAKIKAAGAPPGQDFQFLQYSIVESKRITIATPPRGKMSASRKHAQVRRICAHAWTQSADFEHSPIGATSSRRQLLQELE